MILQKITKIHVLLYGNIHLHAIRSLQYLSPDVSHFAYNAIFSRVNVHWRHKSLFK